MEKDVCYLIKNHEVLGVINNYKLLLFHPGLADDALLYTIEKYSYESFVEEGFSINYQKEIDPYDRIYSHLVLWNDEINEIIGWYRFSKTAETISRYGIDGLYSSTLFQFSDETQQKLLYGFEIGRTFIQPKYRKTLALAYLWGGILKYIFREGSIKYMYGLMSIGSSFPPIAKAYIVYFYTLYFGSEIHKHVIPNKQYTISESELSEIKTVIKGNNYQEDFIQLNEQLKAKRCLLPNAIKHSMSFCEQEGTQVLATGVDPDFGNCVDIFSLVEVNKIKPLKLNKYSKLINNY